MREMQARRSHIAMIVYEYGRFFAIVCVEDIVKGIVAKSRLEKLNRLTGATLRDVGDFDTLAGVLNSGVGAIAQTGDRFFVGGQKLVVMQRDDRRLKTLRVARWKASHQSPVRS
jgi:putative hemolysin